MSGEHIAGVILAGGQSSRMGFLSKPLLPLGSKSLIEHVICCAVPQLPRLLVNANQDHSRYAALGFPLCADLATDQQGPLVGILSAMLWYAQQANPPEYLISLAGDVPFFPANLVERLHQSVCNGDNQVAYSQIDKQIEPLFACWSMSLLPTLTLAVTEGIVSPKRFFRDCRTEAVQFPRQSPEEFFNINEIADLKTAEMFLLHRNPD